MNGSEDMNLQYAQAGPLEHTETETLIGPEGKISMSFKGQIFSRLS